MIGEKNDPVLQGTNGMLSAFSFLLRFAPWAYDLLDHFHQSERFSLVSRALGMRKGGILSMLVAEQLWFPAWQRWQACLSGN